MFPLLLLMACIERVTDQAVPLDPRFYAGGGDAENPAGAEGQLGVPWAGVPGESVTVQFALSGMDPGLVQLDVVVEDAKAPGGLQRIGRIEGSEPTLALSVPRSVTRFAVEVFQDPGQDGPSADDPYAKIDVDMAKVPDGPIPVPLVVGARPAASAQGGGAVEPWAGQQGESVTFTAILLTEGDGEIQVDFAEPAPSEPGGQKRVGQLRLPVAGAFTVEVPRAVQSFRIEAFQDQAGDGPDQADPYAELTVTVAQIGPDPVQLTLVPGSRGAAGSGGAGGPGPAGAAPSGEPAREPWAEVSGPKTTFRATIVAPDGGEVQVDVNEADPKAQGGQRRVGERRLRGSGEVSFEVPDAVASFKIEAFQDPGHDGPSESDPYAELTVTAAQVSTPATLTLVAGARGRPGAPAAPPPAAAEPAPAADTVLISGKLSTAGAGKVYVDLFKAGAVPGAGRQHLYKAVGGDGAWQVRVPKDLGVIEIDAYQDRAGDGPSRDDPQAHYPKKVVVAAGDVVGIDLELK